MDAYKWYHHSRKDWLFSQGQLPTIVWTRSLCSELFIAHVVALVRPTNDAQALRSDDALRSRVMLIPTGNALCAMLRISQSARLARVSDRLRDNASTATPSGGTSRERIFKGMTPMSSLVQKERAAQFRQLHHAPLLVLANIWDAASARIIEQAGFRAIATTSSGVAAALGYRDGQQISKEMLIEALNRITRVVECPVTADIEAGYGNSIEEVLHTVKAVIATGVVGINIEDSLIHQEAALADLSYQMELIKALRELATSIDVPFVINARVDVFLRAIGKPESRFEHAVQRANAYLQAGADCVYPIGILDRMTVANLVKAINGPINILGGPSTLALSECEQLGVARVSLAGGLMRSALGHLRAVAHELLEHGTYASMNVEALSGEQFRSLFP